MKWFRRLLIILVICGALIWPGCSVKRITDYSTMKYYRSYIDNQSPHYVEYVVRKMPEMVDFYSGIIPPKWACENPQHSFKGIPPDPGDTIPWVQKLEIAENMLGEFHIAIRFLFTREGAQEDGPWVQYKVMLTKDMYKDPSLIPYFEVVGEERR